MVCGMKPLLPGIHSPESFESKGYNLGDEKNETNDQKNKLSIRF